VTGRRVRAEQALLGAVLSDPAGQQDVLDLVRRGDMHRPWHGQVLAAMRRLRGRGVPPGPLEVYEELKTDPDLPRPVSHDAVPLASLMEAAPRAGHAPAYAAMVIDGGIRQRIALAGSRMAQAGGDPDADLDAAFSVVGQARRELDACRARWEALPEPVRRDLPAPHRDDGEYAEAARRARAVRDEIGRLRTDLWTESSAAVEERLASIAQLLAETAAASASQRERLAQRRASREARPQGPEAEAAGAAALHDLCADPSQLASVRGWLQPGHFALPEHGELYAAIKDMHAAGRPVDPVTVSWEASRRGVQVDAADLAGGTGVFAWSNARKGSSAA
jgi:DnaB-like helicase N terminal domain